MKYLKVIILLIAAVLCASVLASCDSSVETIRLKGNASKGYEWDYEPATEEAEDVVEEVERRYWDGNVPGTSDAPGVYLFKMRGKDEGSAQLVFRYVDTNAEGEEFLSTIVYNIEVDANGRITECRPVGVMATEIETVDDVQEATEEP